jgi:membrane protein YqaA with SNARE-associated domain
LIDSSFVPLPLIADLLLMELSSRHSLRMPYYAAMATVGSLLGCIWICWIARKGGQAYSRKTQGHPPGRIRKYIQEYPMASVFLPAVAPFPVPFKPFVVAQGVFRVPFGTFVIGTLLGRGALFSSKHFWERATAWRGTISRGTEMGFTRAGAWPRPLFFPGSPIARSSPDGIFSN